MFTRENPPKALEHEYVKGLIEKGARTQTGYGKGHSLKSSQNEGTKPPVGLSNEDSPTRLTPGIRPMSPDSISEELPSSNLDLD